MPPNSVMSQQQQHQMMMQHRMQMANNMNMMRGPGGQIDPNGGMMGHPHMRPQMNPQMMMQMQQQQPQQHMHMQQQNRPPPPEYSKMMPHQVRRLYYINTLRSLINVQSLITVQGVTLFHKKFNVSSGLVLFPFLRP